MKIQKLYTAYTLFDTSDFRILLICIISFILLLSGCSGIQTDSETWEGISGERLKVTVFEFFLFDEKASADDIKNQIMERLNQRAALLVASHISISLSRDKISKNTDIVLNNKIDEIIKSGKLINYSCNENNYCSADSEYNLAGLQQTLESFNNSR